MVHASIGQKGWISNFKDFFSAISNKVSRAETNHGDRAIF